MSKNLAKLAKHERDKHREDEPELSPQEEKARALIIKGARENGATLSHPDAKGGLAPSLVLHVLKRDRWK